MLQLQLAMDKSGENPVLAGRSGYPACNLAATLGAVSSTARCSNYILWHTHAHKKYTFTIYIYTHMYICIKQCVYMMCYVILCYIISYLTSHHITSHHITSHHITSYHIILYYMVLHCKKKTSMTSYSIVLHHILFVIMYDGDLIWRHMSRGRSIWGSIVRKRIPCSLWKKRRRKRFLSKL